jgi:hypothetical protein
MFQVEKLQVEGPQVELTQSTPIQTLPLHSIDQGQQRKGPSSSRVPGSPALSDVTMASNLSALTFASDATPVSVHGPDEYERTSYYNGITGDGDHPDLVYRSDFLTTPLSADTPRSPSSRSAESSTPRSMVSGTLSVPRFVT